MQNEIDLPARVTIYPTNHCFKKCKHCIFVQDGTINSQAIEFSRLLEVLDDLASHKVLLVGIAGGDPLKYHRIFDLIEEILARQMFPILTLSGAGLNYEMVDRLFKVGIRSVQLSLDGSTSKMHDLYRGDGSFNETINAINMFLARGISVSLAICISIENANDLKNIIHLAGTLGINKLKVQKWKSFESDTINIFHELTTGDFLYLAETTERFRHEYKDLQIHFQKDDIPNSASGSLVIMANGDLKKNEFFNAAGNIKDSLPSDYLWRNI